jgi:hypothetical protein
LVFRRLGKITGYKRCRGEKMKCENAGKPKLIRKSRSQEFWLSEIFHGGHGRGHRRCKLHLPSMPLPSERRRIGHDITQ